MICPLSWKFTNVQTGTEVLVDEKQSENKHTIGLKVNRVHTTSLNRHVDTWLVGID